MTVLTIHDKNLNKVAFIDNDKQGTLNYYNDEWIRFLETGASTYSFEVPKKRLAQDTNSQHVYDNLNDQSFVSFEYEGDTFLFNVMQVEENEKSIKITAEDLSLEMLNESVGAYKATEAMTFVEYMDVWNIRKHGAIKVGINEVKDKELTLEWTGEESKLKRLVSIANKFDAEIEFKTLLNDNSTLKEFRLNIYKANDGDKVQGVGKKTNKVFKYYKDDISVSRTIDKSEIYNALKPVGKKEVTTTTTEKVPVIKTGTSKTVNASYKAGDLVYSGHRLSKANINKIIEFGRKFKLMPSAVITQLYLESFWGDSAVGRANNNWSGMSGGAQKRPSGIVVKTGSRRPAAEGGTYFKYKSVSDFLYDYMYLLRKGGIYNVSGKTSITSFAKGLFTVGGARANYAASGYGHYVSLMSSIYRGIQSKNKNKLSEIDKVWRTKPKKVSTAVKSTTSAINDKRIENMIKWMEARKGKVTYSMAARTGPRSFDCSSAVYYAMRSGGFKGIGTWPFSTESEHNALKAAGFKLIAEGTNKKWSMQRGDIIIWGKKGYSAGVNCSAYV